MSDDNTLHYYDNPCLDVDLIIHAVMLSDDKMFVSPDGKRVYFLSNQPGTFLIRIDSIDQTNYKLMSADEIREHVKFRLRETGRENDIDYQGSSIS